jgi:hypothetical protein
MRGSLRPSSDNTYDIGSSSLRYDDIYATSGTVNTSDRRFKKDIRKLSYGLKELMQLKPVIFKWKDGPNQSDKIGLIAQDLLPVISEVVKTYDYQPTEDSPEQFVRTDLDRLGVYYSDLIPVLIKGMQEQQQMITDLQKEVSDLKKALKK